MLKRFLIEDGLHRFNLEFCPHFELSWNSFNCPHERANYWWRATYSNSGSFKIKHKYMQVLINNNDAVFSKRFWSFWKHNTYKYKGKNDKST